MDDEPDDKPGETPIQRALRLKTAALGAKPRPPRGGKFQRQQALGKAKPPWLKK